MLGLIGICLVVWAVGRRLGWSSRLLWGLIGLAYLAAVVAAAVLPEGNGLRESFGGGVMPLLVLGGVAGLVALYAFGLRKLKARAEPPEEEPRGLFREAELERYARHIVLRELGGPGQKRLKEAKVLVIGAGGLGSPALMYLAAAGVGTIGVIDDDVVDHTNMQRQVIHRDEAIGLPKVQSAAAAMQGLNPYLEVKAYQRRLEAGIAEELIGAYDLVLDGTDNFETRYLANAACVKRGKPLISGALAQWEGQLSVFDPTRGGPCYQCVFPEAPEPGLAPSCAVAGVAGPLPGVIGSMMALEAVKLIAGAGQVLCGEMLIYDGLYGESRKIKVAARADCPVCGRSEPA